jgi:histidine triad (HIT) family protein
MELNQEQIEGFKKQIIQQITTNFSEDKKAPAIERIKAMNNEEFMDFLKKNKLIESDSNEEDEETGKLSSQETPFRLIAEGKLPSYKIDENKEGIAVLEINPVSKGHVLIIPKKAVLSPAKMPKSILSLAKNIAKKIEKEFKPKEVLISTNNSLGEIIVNLLPVYSNETLSSPRKQASKDELESLKDVLGRKSKVEKVKPPKIKKIEESKIWFPRRIP